MGLEPYSGADGNGDGTTGPEDYQVWVDHFGQTVSQGSGAGSQGAAVVAQGGQSPFSATLVVNHTQDAKMGTDPVAPAAAPLASAATPNQGGKEEGGRGKEETLARGALSFAVSLSTNPTARVFAVRPRPDAAINLSADTRTEAGLLAWLASRDDARRAMDSADGEDVLADRSDGARSESGLDRIDEVFGTLLAGSV
jgi:hypothetical protein